MLDLTNARKVPIPLTGGVINIVRADGPMSVGRSFTVGSTGAEYSEEELELIDVEPTGDTRRTAGETAAAAAKYSEAVKRNPFTPGPQMVDRFD